MPGRQRVLERLSPFAQSRDIDQIRRGAELLGHVGDSAPAQRQATFTVQRGVRREDIER